MAITASSCWYPIVGTVLLFHAALAQPTQCQVPLYTLGSCIESHPYLCRGTNEDVGGGICSSSSTDSCCCVNAAGTLSSTCDPDGVHNLCCDGHCLDPDEWECCGREKCLKETHLCLEEEGICVQKGNPGLEIPVLIVLGTIWCCCCCCCCLLEAKIWLPRCVFATLVIGAFLITLGFATWDTTGPLDRRPLVIASIVVLPLGVLGLCLTACMKDDQGNTLLWASINERVVTKVIDAQGNVLAENVQVRQANHFQPLPQQLHSGQIRGLQAANIGQREESKTTVRAPPQRQLENGVGQNQATAAENGIQQQAAPAPNGGLEKKIEIC